MPHGLDLRLARDDARRMGVVTGAKATEGGDHNDGGRRRLQVLHGEGGMWHGSASRSGLLLPGDALSTTTCSDELDGDGSDVDKDCSGGELR